MICDWIATTNFTAKFTYLMASKESQLVSRDWGQKIWNVYLALSDVQDQLRIVTYHGSELEKWRLLDRFLVGSRDSLWLHLSNDRKGRCVATTIKLTLLLQAQLMHSQKCIISKQVIYFPVSHLHATSHQSMNSYILYYRWLRSLVPSGQQYSNSNGQLRIRTCGDDADVQLKMEMLQRAVEITMCAWEAGMMRWLCVTWTSIFHSVARIGDEDA